MSFTRKQKSDLGVWELTENIMAFTQNSHQQESISHSTHGLIQSSFSS
jgi:hypothetical protein